MLTQAFSNFAASCTAKGTSLVPTWYKYLEVRKLDGDCQVVDFDITKHLPRVGLAVFEIILFIGGVAAVVMIFYGGFQYLISQGNPESSKNARSTIINALIGLVITLSAVAVVNLIGRNI